MLLARGRPHTSPPAPLARYTGHVRNDVSMRVRRFFSESFYSGRDRARNVFRTHPRLDSATIHRRKQILSALCRRRSIMRFLPGAPISVDELTANKELSNANTRCVRRVSARRDTVQGRFTHQMRFEFSMNFGWNDPSALHRRRCSLPRLLLLIVAGKIC
ncbi:hypothetical protein EVAR_22759_1 [Eumeta japonica]|uniref:Uncharacterized protein n=1 Tax=Eumeta variegata TaxID=151549 RepID=A0A4C1UTM7_EUMVA|nr:hypothetical protein EVAR_22759_1 [Eumeta japonica]